MPYDLVKKIEKELRKVFSQFDDDGLADRIIASAQEVVGYDLSSCATEEGPAHIPKVGGASKFIA